MRRTIAIQTAETFIRMVASENSRLVLGAVALLFWDAGSVEWRAANTSPRASVEREQAPMMLASSSAIGEQDAGQSRPACRSRPTAGSEAYHHLLVDIERWFQQRTVRAASCHSSARFVYRHPTVQDWSAKRVASGVRRRCLTDSSASAR